MTAEQRTVIVPRDIVAIELECRNCHSRIRYAIEKVQTDRLRRLTQCPNCKEELVQPHVEGPETERLAAFVEALKVLMNSSSPAIVRLEIANLEPQPPKRS